MAWTWVDATPAERSEWVRQHMRGSRPLSFDQTATLFGLSDVGLRAILRGRPWTNAMSAHWTDERVEQLKTLWADGFSASQVARLLGGGLTRNAVIGKVHRMGLALRGNPGTVARQSPRGELRKILRAPEPPPEPVALDPIPGVTIANVTDKQCRWPYGDPADREHFHLCGHPTITLSPYCAAHARKAFTPGYVPCTEGRGGRGIVRDLPARTGVRVTQNRSHAVMAQRAEPHDSLDHFPTPPWATRALCEHVIDIRGKVVWEPACGEGYMAEPLKECALTVRASDVHDYGYGDVSDFLFYQDRPGTDWIITNPPFRLAQQFVDKGLTIARIGVAVLVRSVFIESIGRYEQLFKTRPPSIMAQFVERVPMVKGRVDPTASTATSYCWLVWYRDPPPFGTQLKWIPPCRSKLERASDYEPEVA